MIITKYFSRAEEVISCGPYYKALYNALAHAYVEGIDNTVYLTEEQAPIISMCNCVKSVGKYITGARRSAKMIFAMLDDLCVDDEGKNLDPAVIPGASYIFFIPSFLRLCVCTCCADNKRSVSDLRFNLSIFQFFNLPWGGRD